MRELSKDSLKDPTQTKTLRASYERELVRLFKDFKKATMPEERDLALSYKDITSDFNDFLRKLENFIHLRILEPGKNITDIFVLKGYRAGGLRAAQRLKGLGIASTFILGPADREAVKILKTRNFEALKGITAEMSKGIVQELTTGIQKGEHPNKLAKRLRGVVDDMSIPRSKTMARTETINTYVQASLKQFKKFDIEEVEWLTAWDERVCPNCGPLNKKIFDIDSHPDCPLHPNCRCELLPVIEEV